MLGGTGRTGRPAASSQQNNSSALTLSQEKGCRASPGPGGTGAREEAAWTLLLPRLPHGTGSTGSARMETFEHHFQMGEREDEMGKQGLWEHRLA